MLTKKNVCYATGFWDFGILDILFFEYLVFGMGHKDLMDEERVFG